MKEGQRYYSMILVMGSRCNKKELRHIELSEHMATDPRGYECWIVNLLDGHGPFYDEDDTDKKYPYYPTETVWLNPNKTGLK